MKNLLKQSEEQHLEILSALDEMGKAIRSGEKIDTGSFRMLLEKHKNMEERLVYPEFDNVLSDKDKEEVYSKIKR